MPKLTTKTKCFCGKEIGDHLTIDLVYCLMTAIERIEAMRNCANCAHLDDRCHGRPYCVDCDGMTKWQPQAEVKR